MNDTIMIRKVSPELKRSLCIMAAEQGISLPALIKRLLQAVVDKRGGGK